MFQLTRDLNNRRMRWLPDALSIQPSASLQVSTKDIGLPRSSCVKKTLRGTTPVKIVSISTFSSPPSVRALTKLSCTLQCDVIKGGHCNGRALGLLSKITELKYSVDSRLVMVE